MWWRAGGLGVVVVSVLALAGCGGKVIEYLDGSAPDGQTPPPSHPFNCSIRSPCPRDPPSTPASIDQCNRLLQGPCATQYQAFGDCLVTNFKCTSAGTIDSQATIALCQAEYAALLPCLNAPFDGGGLGDP
jgi:hypothetical protein